MENLWKMRGTNEKVASMQPPFRFQSFHDSISWKSPENHEITKLDEIKKLKRMQTIGFKPSPSVKLPLRHCSILNDI